MTEKRMICLSCPVGCQLTVTVENGEVLRVDGNACPRGDVYGRQEAIEPMRTLPTSVRVTAGTRDLVSVKTDRPIPLDLIPAAMDLIREISVAAPVRIHDVVLDDLLGTGAKLVATRDVPAACG